MSRLPGILASASASSPSFVHAGTKRFAASIANTAGLGRHVDQAILRPSDATASPSRAAMPVEASDTTGEPSSGTATSSAWPGIDSRDASTWRPSGDSAMPGSSSSWTCQRSRPSAPTITRPAELAAGSLLSCTTTGPSAGPRTQIASMPGGSACVRSVAPVAASWSSDGVFAVRPDRAAVGRPAREHAPIADPARRLLAIQARHHRAAALLAGVDERDAIAGRRHARRHVPARIVLPATITRGVAPSSRATRYSTQFPAPSSPS